MKMQEGSLEVVIQGKTQEIKSAMRTLGRRLEAGDDSKVVQWVLADNLACAHRPLRHHPIWGGSGSILPPEATNLIFEWADRVRHEGIRSIISLMHDRDVRCYQQLNLRAASLLEFYSTQGFQVSHVPWEDPHHKKSSPYEKMERLIQVRKEALAAYCKLPKPVLVQCSAGIDRSSPVAAFILVKTGIS